MLFVPDGPDVPNALVAEQERGNVLFVCGAGVSKAAGLPSFRSLVEGVYHRLGESWERHPAEREVMVSHGRLEGQFDRALRCLERRLAASDVRKSRNMRARIREAVEQELAPSSGVGGATRREAGRRGAANAAGRLVGLRRRLAHVL